MIAIQTTQVAALNYVEPTYNITENKGILKIEVDTKIAGDNLERVDSVRNLTLAREAKSYPLHAVAFIQKLAEQGDTPSKQIQSLYQAYHKFIEDSDRDNLLKSCKKVSDSEDYLAKSFAQYLLAILTGKQIDSTLEDARDLLNALIPELQQTLTMKLPKKVYKEQEVIFDGEQSSHKAFPDLIQYKGVYYACFREAQYHVKYQDRGKIRILKGDFNLENQTWKWESIALLSSPEYDLRDPKFFVNHENHLKIIMGGSVIDKEDQTTAFVPHVAKLIDSKWALQKAIVDESANGDKGQWIWRVTWNPHDNKGYALSYGKNSSISLMKTSDGIKFEKVSEIACAGMVDLTEATLRFKTDGSAIILIRCRKFGIIGTATREDAYQKWSLNVIPFRVQGQNLVILKDQKRMWAATRHFFLNEDNTLDEATIIASMNEKSLIPAIRLKSHLDTSYPGMVLEDDGSTTVIYYSSESDQKSNLYITRVKLPE